MNRSTSITRSSSRQRKPRLSLGSPKAKAEDPTPEEPLKRQERLLDQIAQGAQLCQEVERQLQQHPVPELQTIIRLHRTLVLKLSVDAQAEPGLFNLVSTLMRP